MCNHFKCEVPKAKADYYNQVVQEAMPEDNGHCDQRT